MSNGYLSPCKWFLRKEVLDWVTYDVERRIALESSCAFQESKKSRKIYSRCLAPGAYRLG